LPDPHTENIEQKNKDIVEDYSNLMTNIQKSTILDDMNAL
jgi:hypothetical protein